MVEVGFELRKVGTEIHYAVTLALAKGTLVLFSVCSLSSDALGRQTFSTIYSRNHLLLCPVVDLNEYFSSTTS